MHGCSVAVGYKLISGGDVSGLDGILSVAGVKPGSVKGVLQMPDFPLAV